MSENDREILLYPLAPLTSWHIGGVAERFFSPTDVTSLAEYLIKIPPEVNLTWLGLGSNVLIRDKGIRGVVIATRQFNKIFQLDQNRIEAQAGATCAKFSRYCARLGLPAAAFFAGIPGTIGGALAMNAGAWDGQTWDWVEAVQVINRQGECFYRSPQDYKIGYREVKGIHPEQVDEAFVGAQFSFPHQPELDGLTHIKTLLRKRAQSQPIGTYNCGSVYRNPPGNFAAKLIEGCELKGYRVGDAMVSPKHANFIINCDKATAMDVENLMRTIESRVLDQFGISLQAEVKILGEP